MTNSKPTLKNRAELRALVNGYFKYIEGEYRVEKKPGNKNDEEVATHKVSIRDAEPASMSALVLHLGFNSRDEFDALEKAGRYSSVLKRARLQVEAAYEKRLLQPSPNGAMFALKNMGWNEKADTEKIADAGTKKFTVVVIETGPAPASNEREVLLS